MFKPGAYIRHKETGVLVRVKEDTEYSSDLAELAPKDSYYTPLEIIQICDTKIGDWIYLKDL